MNGLKTLRQTVCPYILRAGLLLTASFLSNIYWVLDFCIPLGDPVESAQPFDLFHRRLRFCSLLTFLWGRELDPGNGSSPLDGQLWCINYLLLDLLFIYYYFFLLELLAWSYMTHIGFRKFLWQVQIHGDSETVLCWSPAAQNGCYRNRSRNGAWNSLRSGNRFVLW